MATFLLIHGAFRGAWAWARVTPLLSERGHEAVAIDLPLAGDTWRPDADAVDLDAYVEAVVRCGRTLPSPIVVGHSQGGFVAGCSAGRAPSVFAAVAYLDAPAPELGKRAIDLRAPGYDGAPLPDLAPDLVIPAQPVEASSWMTESDAKHINERLVPQPVGPSLDRVTALPPSDLPSFTAFCEHSSPMVPARHTRLLMDGNGEPYTLFDADHDITITQPQLVATWLDDIATKRMPQR